MTRSRLDRTRERLTRLIYAAGKLQQAVRVLTLDKHIIQHRLGAAYRNISVVMEADLPIRYQPKLRWIKHELTKKPPRYPLMLGDPDPGLWNGRLVSTLQYMRPKKAIQIAGRLVDLADAVTENKESRQRWIRAASLLRVQRRSKLHRKSPVVRGRARYST